MPGSLSVTVGCMFAGKSTLAVSTVRRWRWLEKNVLVLKHSCDTRYGENTGMFTHDADAALVMMPDEEEEMENAGGRAAGKLWVDIWAATGLRAADRGGRSHPYVSVSLLGLPAGASVAHATLKTP